MHDPDGLNPYGREVALTLAPERDVLLLLARDAEWVPEGLTVRKILPGNRGTASKPRQALSLAHGLATLLGHCAFGRKDLLVAWSRSWVEDLVIALLSVTGTHTAVVEHNPGRRSVRTGLRGRTSRLALRAAGAVIVHGPRLAAEAGRGLQGQRIEVCSHPPFDTWWSWASAGMEAARAPSQVSLLLLGQPRPDKGLDQLEAMVSAVPSHARARLLIRWCGFRPSGTKLPDLAHLVQVDDRSASRFLDDHAIARSILDSSALLAPMRGATQSGTVILALSAGLPVLAFDEGELASVVDQNGLVAAGDLRAMADKITQLVEHGIAGGSRVPLETWRRTSREQWSRALQRATTRSALTRREAGR